MKTSLNHIFRTIWSDVLGTWVAVSELAHARGKLRSCGAGRAGGSVSFSLKPLCMALACCYGLNAQANPVGAQVVNGTASISQSGATLTVTNTPGAIINWQGFSINSGETTRFVQQSSSSAVLNRVVGPDPSKLLGTLTSNGQVYLINPAGIMVGQGAVIDVPRFVASTLNLSNADFLAGKLNFTAQPGAGSISNQGTITTPDGGSVYLVAPQVENSGIITTPKGETILAAGDTVTLVDTGTPGVTVQVTGSANTATNLGQIIADTGRIGMVGALVKNSGVINANSLVSQGGRVFLKATAHVETSGTISANGITGGTVEVLGPEVGVMDGAGISANGMQGGGTVLVGGDYQGKNAAVQNARVTYVAPTASISADATDNGNGGKVVVWADDTTRFYGNISARGGANGGNGGFVETSGHNYIDFRGNVDTSAPLGTRGNLLIDPSDITISAAADNLLGGTFTTGWFTGATGAANISWGTIQTQLNTNSVEIRTTAGAGGTGIITVSGSATLTGANYLALVANSNIVFSAGASLSTGGELDLIAGWNNTGWAVTAGTGTITFNAGSNINTSGNLKMVAGSNISLADATVKSTGNMTVDLGGNLSLAATNNSTWLQSSGTQTITFNGAGANTLTLTGSTTAATANASAVIQSTGMQTISNSAGTLGITLTAGSSSANTQNAYQWNNGVQGSLICTACATFNWAGIESQGGQSITASTITLNGGSGGNGNHASIHNQSSTAGQTITTTATGTGAISLTGGSSGGYYNSAFPNDSVSNEASINSNGSQTINAVSINLTGGGGAAATLGGAMLTAKAAQSITTTTGNLTMTGGNSTATGQYGLGSPAVIGEQVGQSITLNIGGILAMSGGGNAANAALIGGASGSPSISITAASGISMASVSQIGVLTGGPGGTLTLMKATSGNITEDSTSSINVATITSMLASAGSISMSGSNKVNTATSLSGSAGVSYTSAQTVHIGTATASAGNVTLTSTGAGSHLYLGSITGAIVNATSSGGIYDDNGSGVTNVTATTSSTLISTGAVLGNLGVSADVNTPSVTATVSGAYGGIRIGNTSATLPTTVALTDSATTTPQGVSFENWVTSVFTLPAAGWTFSPGTGLLTISSSGAMVIPGTLSKTGPITLQAKSGGLTVNTGASVTSGGALVLIAGTAWSAIASDVITLNGTISGGSVSLEGNSVTGTIPAGATQKTGASAAVQQTVATLAATSTTTTSTSTATTGTSSTTASVTTSGTPTTAVAPPPPPPPPPPTTSSGAIMAGPAGGTAGGTTGTFGGTDPSLGTSSTSSTSSTAGSSTSGSSTGGSAGSSSDSSSASDSSGNGGKGTKDKGGKDEGKDKSDAKEGSGKGDKGNGKDDEGKTNANPEKC